MSGRYLVASRLGIFEITLLYWFLAMVIVMKVVGIDKIKFFRNFIFQNQVVIFTGYQHLRRLFFQNFDMGKTSKITKSA